MFNLSCFKTPGIESYCTSGDVFDTEDHWVVLLWRF